MQASTLASGVISIADGACSAVMLIFLSMGCAETGDSHGRPHFRLGLVPHCTHDAGSNLQRDAHPITGAGCCDHVPRRRECRQRVAGASYAGAQEGGPTGEA